MDSTKIPEIGSRWLRNESAARGKGLHVVVEKIETGQIGGADVVRVRYRHEASGRSASAPLCDFLRPSGFLPAPAASGAPPRSTADLARELLPILEGLTPAQIGKVLSTCEDIGTAFKWVDAAAMFAPPPPVPTAHEARSAFLELLHGRGTAEHRETVLWYLFCAVDREERAERSAALGG